MKKTLTVVFTLAIFSAFAGASELYEVKAPKEERDLICGLQPYKFPRWMSEIELINGKKLHFVSVKCMMLFYYKNDKWSDLDIKDDKVKPEKGQTSSEFQAVQRETYIKAMRVQDYKSSKTVDAKKAYYVFGSRLIGPKGDDLVPFKYEAEAKAFIKENGGRKMLRFENFKLNLFDLLNI